jgi:hypothetical protein
MLRLLLTSTVRSMTELARTALLDILVEGYVRPPNVAGTVSLIRDADRVVIVDPGMVADRELISAHCANSASGQKTSRMSSLAITTSTTP